MPKTCFLVIDFDDAPSESVARQILSPKGYECIRTDRTGKPGSFLREVVRGIGAATIVLVDITGDNPNVFYELGIAHAFRKQTIVVKKTSDGKDLELPADLSQYKVIGYQDSIKGAEKLAKRLDQAVRALQDPPCPSDYLREEIEEVNARDDIVNLENMLSRVVTNAVHPITAILLATNAKGAALSQIRAVSPDANKFYGYPPQAKNLVGKDLKSLLRILKKWMDPADFKSFRREQTKLAPKVASGQTTYARTPIRFNSEHPDPEVQGRAYLPMVLGITEPVGENKAQFTIVLYLDLFNLPRHLLVEAALPDQLRRIMPSRARKERMDLAEYVANLLQRAVGPPPRS